MKCIVKRPCVRLKLWVCASPVLTCLKVKMGRKLWKSIRRPDWKGLKAVPNLTSPGPSSTTLRPKSISRKSTFASGLTVSRGYGVTEIHIPEGSEYIGKSINESGLREKDINVLTLYRGTTVIPNPRAQRLLEAVIGCFVLANWN